MERAVELKFENKRYTLIYTVRVMLDVIARFGGENELLDAIQRPGMERVEAVLWLFIREAEEGNLYRAARGRKPSELPDPELLRYEMTTFEYVQIQRAVTEAFVAGHRREIEDAEAEEDVGLAELEKKTAPARRRLM